MMPTQLHERQQSQKTENDRNADETVVNPAAETL